MWEACLRREVVLQLQARETQAPLGSQTTSPILNKYEQTHPPQDEILEAVQHRA